jgi:hypothetical protein
MLSAVICVAQTPAVTSFSNGTAFVTIDGTNLTAGWTFTVNQTLTVSALGFWEFNTSLPLTATHPVGLWNSTGTLLASATVQTNSPVTGSWRYASITPVTLTAGQSYVVGSDITTPFSDPYERVPVGTGSVSTAGLITINSSILSTSASGFTFPTVPEPGFIGRFGPNLLVTAVPPVTAVPITPWALAAIGITLLASGLLGLRRSRRAFPLS